MVRAWLSPSRAQSWLENTSKSSASKVSRFARSPAVRFTGNGGLSTPPSAGSGIGTQPADGPPGPGVHRDAPDLGCGAVFHLAGVHPGPDLQAKVEKLQEQLAAAMDVAQAA